MANNNPRFEKIASPAAAMAGTLSRSGWPRRSSNAATGNTAMGSINARPRGWSLANSCFMGSPGWQCGLNRGADFRCAGEAERVRCQLAAGIELEFAYQGFQA